MDRKIIRLILISLLAMMLVGCEDTVGIHQTQPPETPPKETAVSTELPSKETATATEEPLEVTGPSMEETPEVTAPPTETPEVTARPTATPPPTPTLTVTPMPSQPPIGTSTAVPYPSAPGTAVVNSGSAVLDYSNAEDGYVMIKWTGEDAKVAVQVTGPNNPEAFTYYLRTDGDYDVLPLSDGDGIYEFVVGRNISGTKYTRVLSASISVQFDDNLAPFLRPNQYVSYSAGSEVVKKRRGW